MCAVCVGMEGVICVLCVCRYGGCDICVLGVCVAVCV